MQIILAIILLLIAIAVARAIFRFVLKAAGAALAIAVALPLAPPFLLGFGTERALRPLRCGFQVAFVGMVTADALAVQQLLGEWSAIGRLDWVMVAEVALLSMLGIKIAIQWSGRRDLLRRSLPLPYFEERAQNAQALVLSSVAMFGLATVGPHVASQLDDDGLIVGAAIAYIVVALLVLLYVVVMQSARQQVSKIVHAALSEQDKVNADEMITRLERSSALGASEIKIIFDGIAAAQVMDGVIEEFEIGGCRWFFKRGWYQRKLSTIDKKLSSAVRYSRTDLAALTSRHLALPPAANDDFIEQYLDLGEFHGFADGVHFVSFKRISEVRRCASCGLTEVHEQGDATDSEWFCSTICEKTEQVCEALREKSRDTFLSEAVDKGLVVMAGAQAWVNNQKLFATGGQGHGLAAEVANNRIDQLLGKRAKVVGGNNAKHGPDRISNGALIQSKYCLSPGKTVGQGFGPDGMYRYRAPDGGPMQLEVPRDQYDQAVELMRRRMRAGKVLDRDGNPMPSSKAETLIRKGHLTYEQSKNVVKFGTVESIVFDIVEGTITSAAAGGISFGISAFMYYVNTQDHEAALRAATVQGSKTFGTTMLVYVSAQQLHRLAMVQKTLAYVEFSGTSRTTLRVLENGLGVRGVEGVNKAVRGTVVTSMVLIAVTTGPELIKLIRGRISEAQFLKNVAVGTSGIVGGTVGGFVGGALMSPLGPVGAIAGRIAGGVVGGLIASGIASVVADKFVEDDRVAMLAIVRDQTEYLAKAFLLSSDELDNLNANLEKVVTQEMLELLYVEKENRRALANHYLKPTVIAVVKQRPPFAYQLEDLTAACEQLAA